VRSGSRMFAGAWAVQEHVLCGLENVCGCLGRAGECYVRSGECLRVLGPCRRMAQKRAAEAAEGAGGLDLRADFQFTYSGSELNRNSYRIGVVSRPRVAWGRFQDRAAQRAQSRIQSVASSTIKVQQMVMKLGWP